MTGRRVGDRVEITGGLDAQTRASSRSGAGFLTDGDLVRVVEQPRRQRCGERARPALRTRRR